MIAKNSRKIFVLDTSVLIYDACAYKSFIDNDVIIPITVLDELDKLKKSSNGVGKNARTAIRNLDAISELGKIHEGIEIEDGIIIKVDTSGYGSIGDPKYGDSKILACASKIKEENPETCVILVSKDINLRVRARAFELDAEDYEKDKIETDELYTGYRTIQNNRAGLDLFSQEYININSIEGLEDLIQNEYVLFTDEFGKGIAPGKRVGNEIKFVKDRFPWNLKLRNKEQLFAADLLMDTNIPLVSVIGRAGSGKTLTTLACALDLVLEQKKYDNLIIYRPMFAVSSEIGFIPGEISDKLAPWYGPIDDAFAFLFSDKKKNGWKTQLHQYIDSGIIQKEALTYIRGRSLNNALIILDEAQNLTKDEIKTILTRVGVGSKIIVNGDIEQIDNPVVDQTNCGLSIMIDTFKGSELYGHINLVKGERSALATLASEIL